MRLRSLLPWSSAAGRRTVPEKKAAGGFMSLAAGGRASWTGRSYAALSREGFMKNPVAHRSVRLVAEAAASVPWLLYEGDHERPDHAILSLLGQPNGRMGPRFLRGALWAPAAVGQCLCRAADGRRKCA